MKKLGWKSILLIVVGALWLIANLDIPYGKSDSGQPWFRTKRIESAADAPSPSFAECKSVLSYFAAGNSFRSWRALVADPQAFEKEAGEKEAYGILLPIIVLILLAVSLMRGGNIFISLRKTLRELPNIDSEAAAQSRGEND